MVGLYAELVKNRSFEFDDPRDGMDDHLDREGEKVLTNDQQSKNKTNPRYAKIKR